MSLDTVPYVLLGIFAFFVVLLVHAVVKNPGCVVRVKGLGITVEVKTSSKTSDGNSSSAAHRSPGDSL